MEPAGKEALQNCPVCDAGSQMDVAPYNDFDMSRCPSCTFVYTTVRDIPTEQYDEVYEGLGFYDFMLRDAQRAYAGDYGFKDLWWFKRLGLRWLDKEGNKGKLLDVGCGPGTFIMIANTRGWDASGIEPANAAAEKARSFGQNVYAGIVEDYAQETGQDFDALTCYEVLEHVQDPIGMLRAMHSITTPGGLLLMSVPNLDDPYCMKQRLKVAMPPIHINFFNRKSLRHALEKTGFEVVRFKTLPIPTSSVRNCHGKFGFVLRVPVLAILSMLGRADGTTLVALARRKQAST